MPNSESMSRYETPSDAFLYGKLHWQKYQEIHDGRDGNEADLDPPRDNVPVRSANR